jgi:SAM-dependent methyltransferase
MSIAYYAQPPESEHWTQVWRAESLPRLIAVALRDPLTSHILRHLSTDGIILEAGCGLGQYVAILRDHGFRALGGDFSLQALTSHRHARAGSPLVGLDLLHMPFGNGVFHGLVCLGVIEHLQEGPQAMLAEFHRTLAPDGALLVSVPWVNGYRSLVKASIEHKQARQRASGAEFYQYAFTADEVRSFLEGSEFQVQAFYPYSPAKGMRDSALLRRLLPTTPDLSLSQGRASKPAQGAGTSQVSGLRRMLYWRPVLHWFAHMILIVAHKQES